MVKSPARKGLESLLFGAAMFASALSFSSKSYAQDSDSDGLSDIYETTVSFTNPSLSDSDGDYIPDGAEEPNPGMANPNDINNPTGGQMNSIMNSTKVVGDGISHRMYPAVSNDGETIAYVVTDSDYSNPRISISSVDGGSTTDSLTTINDLDIPYIQLSFLPGDTEIAFSDNNREGNGTRNIYKVRISDGQVTNMTGSVSPSDQYHSPFAVNVPTTSEGDWVFMGTNSSGTTKIKAYPLSGGSLNMGAGVNIIDVQDVGITGFEVSPKISAEGEFLLHTSPQDGFSNTRARTFITHSIDDILNGIESEVTSELPIGSSLTQSADVAFDVWNQPVGFSPTGNFFYISADETKNFDTSSPDYGFGSSDFDLCIGIVNTGNFGGFNKIKRVGNEFSGSPSKDGLKLYHDTDDDFTTSTLKAVYESDVATHVRTDSHGGPGFPAGAEFVLEDPSGTTLVVKNGSYYALPGFPNLDRGTITMRPLPPGAPAEQQPDNVAAIRVFDPAGADFSVASGGDARLHINYLESDIPQGVNESDLQGYKYNTTTMTYDILLPKLSHDLVNNILEVRVEGFSVVGLKGPEPVNSVDPSVWPLYGDDSIVDLVPEVDKKTGEKVYSYPAKDWAKYE